MIFKSLPAEELKTEVHIHIQCLTCGRETEVRASNAVGLLFKCMKCGSGGFYRVKAE
jgi:predicted RNA-binding Zn-ribbon protein involved in translation (DUF1610 family)